MWAGREKARKSSFESQRYESETALPASLHQHMKAEGLAGSSKVQTQHSLLLSLARRPYEKDEAGVEYRLSPASSLDQWEASTSVLALRLSACDPPGLVFCQSAIYSFERRDPDPRMHVLWRNTQPTSLLLNG